MEITLIHINEVCIAEIRSEQLILNNAQDALELLANCGYQGAEGIILYEQNIHKDFFDLKTVMAGEILQKFSNYRMKLAIVGTFDAYISKSLKDFIYESNKNGRINFVSSMEEAKIALTN